MQVTPNVERALALPLLAEGLGRIEDVANAEDDLGAAHLLEDFERGRQFAAEAGRLFVDDDEVGIERHGGGKDDAGAQRRGLLDIQVQRFRDVVGIDRLDDARHADVVDAGREGEAAGDRRSGEDERRRSFQRGNQRFGDGARAAQMAEPERVVAVKQDMRGAVGLLDSVTHAMIPLVSTGRAIGIAVLGNATI